MILRKTVEENVAIRAYSIYHESIICDNCKKEIKATKESGPVPYYEITNDSGEEFHLCSESCCISKINLLFGYNEDFTVSQRYKCIGTEMEYEEVEVDLRSKDELEIEETSQLWIPHGINTLVSKNKSCITVPITGDPDRLFIPHRIVDPHDIDGFPDYESMTPRSLIKFCKEKVSTPIGMISYFAILIAYYKRLDDMSTTDVPSIVDTLPTTKELLESITHDHGDINKVLEYYDIDYDSYQELPATKTNKIYEIDAVVRSGRYIKVLTY